MPACLRLHVSCSALFVVLGLGASLRAWEGGNVGSQLFVGY